MTKPTLIDTMLNAGIAFYMGADLYLVIRNAKNKCPNGSSTRRELETILKQDVKYIERAVAILTM